MAGYPQALRRLAAYVWPSLQGTAAATAAWLIAKGVLDHPQPLFAPVAAVIALNTSRGERGLNAVRMLQGVVVGVVVGELAVRLIDGGYGAMALAVFTAMTVARLLGGTRITLAQAAVGAILVVATADAEAGTQRLLDALIGAGVALTFSQLLFPPEPVGLVRRAEAVALRDMADGLELTARALEQDDDASAERAVSRLRGLRDRLVELARLRRASSRVARHSLLWRSRRAPVVRENENAGHLDLLGGSCLLFARAAMTASTAQRRSLAPPTRALADALGRLAEQLGHRQVRQHAADQALDVARLLADGDSPAPFAAAVLRMVAADVMIFAGIDPDRADRAVRDDDRQPEVPVPPQRPRTPFGPGRRRPPR